MAHIAADAPTTAALEVLTAAVEANGAKLDQLIALLAGGLPADLSPTGRLKVESAV